MTRITKMMATIATTSVLAVPAFAGSLAEPVVIEPVATPAPVPYSGGNWGGYYGGIQLGYGDVSGRGGLSGIDGDDGIYGVHLGYNHDYGNWVLGGELDYDKMNIGIAPSGGPSAGTIDSVARLKFKAGYDLGQTLVYGTAGVADMRSSVGSDTGNFYGLGVAYQLSDSFTVSGEYLKHSFSDIGGAAGVDAKADTFTVRASYRF